MKKLFRSAAILLALLFTISFSLFAQDTAPTTPGWLSDHIVLILSIVLGVYEVLVRYIPTIRNYSVISLVISIVQFIVPNKAKGGGNHV